MQNIEIPRYIDDAPHFFLWQLDEIAPILLGLVIGMVVGSPMLFAFAGMFVTKFYAKFRDSKPEGFPLHFLYWNGLYPVKSKLAKNPFVRKYFP